MSLCVIRLDFYGVTWEGDGLIFSKVGKGVCVGDEYSVSVVPPKVSVSPLGVLF